MRRSIRINAPPPSGATYVLIAHTAAATSSSGAVTSGIDTTAANALRMAVTSYTGGTYPTLADSTLVAGTPTPTGNVWTKVSDQLGGTSNLYRVTIWHCDSPVVGTGHTFQATGASSFTSVAVAAFSGGTGSSLDQQSGAGTGTNGNVVAAGSVTPGSNNELLVTGVLFNQTGQTVSVDSGFTITDQVGAATGNNFGVALAYKIQTTAAAENPTWTATSATDGMVAAVATFRA